jgi:uncharacterized membrane protein YhhN
MERVILAGLIIGWAGLAIWADGRGRFVLVYIFKPLATALIIVLALAGSHVAGARYERFILAGLACSLVGDVLMMLKKKRFLGGLAAFLAAHVFYILAFSSRLRGPLSLGLLIPFVLYLGFMAGMLGTRLGRMRIPVILYMVVIMAMAVLAAERYHQTAEAGALCALLGSILFVASDSFLAANRFVRPFRWAQVGILGTYFAAQVLIALSA